MVKELSKPLLGQPAFEQLHLLSHTEMTVTSASVSVWNSIGVSFRCKVTVHLLWFTSVTASKNVSSFSSWTPATLAVDLHIALKCPFFLHLWYIASLAGLWCLSGAQVFPHLEHENWDSSTCVLSFTLTAATDKFVIPLRIGWLSPPVELG